MASQTCAQETGGESIETQTSLSLSASASSHAAVQCAPAVRDSWALAAPSCGEASCQTDAWGGIETELEKILRLSPGGSLSLSLQGGRVVVRTGGGRLAMLETPALLTPASLTLGSLEHSR